MNQGWTYQEQVNQAAAGLTLLDYYTQRYRHSSQATWRQRIKSGQVLLDGSQASTETPLRSGQWLTYHRPPWQEPEVPLCFDVLYEDQDLLVVTKPAGLPVLPGGGFLEHTLLRQLQKRYPQATPVPIHRLGRGTSGLMLMARSHQAKSHLSQQMRDRQIHKTYRTLIGRSNLPDHFTITQPIGKIPHPVLGYVYGATPDGLSAHSDCHILKRHRETTLLEVTILTGRPHQIRIHLAAVGYPLIGDPLYDIGGVHRLQSIGADVNTANQAAALPVPGDCGYHLHAHQLAFTHPITGQFMNMLCPTPTELEE
ncbi:MAG: RluA family pseudouridine synthase [Cyanothece sp. SIO1E1]|nr:RluA family pseudouridine synthase [Cyanothece sp. SIO1E1]